MAISKEAQKKIERLIYEHKLFMKYRTIGPQSMTRGEIKDLLTSKFATYLGPAEVPVIEAYLKTHEQVAKEFAPIAVRDGAVKFLEKMHLRYVEKLADQIGADIQSAVENNLMPFIDRREGTAVYEVLKDFKNHAKNLRQTLVGRVDNWQFRYKTIVTTELNRASNWGSLDAIVHNSPELSPDQIYVFKQGNKPHHGACDHCAKFWYLNDGITPKVYLLSELIANGSNIGKKQKDWQPTVDSTHPNETHVLSEIKPGFGFVNGNMTYVGNSYNEFKKQRGLQ
jgi:hypothetical protein